MEVSACVRRVEEAPDRWPLYLHDIRRYIFPYLPFSFVDRFRDGEIVVVAVAHHMRRPGYWRVR